MKPAGQADSIEQGNASVALEVAPLSEALGAEIRGVDLSRDLDAATIGAIRKAWADHLVLRFRGQQLSEAQHLAFTECMGGVMPPNTSSMTALGHPEILLVSNLGPDGQPTDLGLGSAEAVWHSDMTYMDEPPAGSCLYGLEIPPAGGNTCFSNMYKAYETMEPGLREQVSGLRIIHDTSRNSAGRLREGAQSVTDPASAPGPHHPILRTHPVTGRKALYLGRRAYSYVAGYSMEESDALLDRIWAHASQEQFAWCHQWQVGDLIMWDNRCAMHRRDPFDPSHRRVLHRTQIRGDQPR
jgi:taurine dioxygenase